MDEMYLWQTPEAQRIHGLYGWSSVPLFTAFHYHKIFKLDVLDCWYSKTKEDYLLGYDTHFPCNRIFRKVII